MTATNHVITGMIIGAAVHNPVLALPFAFLSHFALDSLPHFGIDVKKHIERHKLILISDITVASLLLLLLVITKPDNWQVITLSGVLAASPDLMWFPHYVNDLSGKPNKPYGHIRKFHSKIQKYEIENLRGMFFEAIWFGAALVVVSQLLDYLS